jgi:hypothetical protein
MQVSYFARNFESVLDKLKTEIEQYPNDESLWRKEGAINNSAGNLCLHLLGNLNTYIGANLGNSGYVRDRPAEFANRGLRIDQLLFQISETKETVVSSLVGLSDADLDNAYPSHEPDSETSLIAQELVKILSHFSYHLGQINYHRRISAK